MNFSRSFYYKDYSKCLLRTSFHGYLKTIKGKTRIREVGDEVVSKPYAISIYRQIQCMLVVGTNANRIKIQVRSIAVFFSRNFSLSI